MGNSQQKQLQLNNNDSDIECIIELESVRNLEDDITHHLHLYKSNMYPTLTEFNNFAEHKSAWDMFLNKIKSIDSKITKIAGSHCININKNITKTVSVDEFFNNLVSLIPIADKEPMFYYTMKIFIDDYQWNLDEMKTFIVMCQYIYKNLNSNDPITVQTIHKWYEKCECVNSSSIYSDHPATDFINKLNLKNDEDIVSSTKELLLNMCEYKITDGSVALYYLLKRRNNFVQIANNQLTLVTDSLKMLNNDITYENLIQKHGHKILCGTEYNFNFVSDPELRHVLCTLHKYLSTPKAKQWLCSEQFEKLSSDSKIFNTFLDHPEIKNKNYDHDLLICGLEELRYMQVNGLELWIKKILASRGVGVRELSFDEGISIKQENVCIYWFNKWLPSESVNFSDNIVYMSLRYSNIYSLCKVVTENFFDKLLDSILSKFGKMLTSEDYFNNIRKLDDYSFNRTLSQSLSQKKYRTKCVFQKYWKEYYYDDMYVNCSHINRSKLILELWNRLPWALEGDHSIHGVPTLNMIDDLLNKEKSVFRLCGKRMHFMNEWDKVATYEFDCDMNEFGAFKKICMSLTSGPQEYAKLRPPDDPLNIIFKKLKY